MSSTTKMTERSFFLARLKELRGTRSKAAFSRHVGIDPAVYQRYENGRVPRYDVLSAIADKCGVTVDWLLGRDLERAQAIHLRAVSTATAVYPESAPPKAAVRDAPAPGARAGPACDVDRLAAIEKDLDTIKSLLLRWLDEGGRESGAGGAGDRVVAVKERRAG